MPRLRWPPSLPFPVHSSLSVATRAFGLFYKNNFYETMRFPMLLRVFISQTLFTTIYSRFRPQDFRPFFREAWSKSIWTNGRGRFDRVFFSFATRLFFRRTWNKLFWTIGRKWFDKIFSFIFFFFLSLSFSLNQSFVRANNFGQLEGDDSIWYLFCFFFFNQSVISEK